MTPSLRPFLLGAVFCLAAAPLGSVPVSPADTLYQQALTSYLSGDYDKALLLSAQSLEKDPGHQKTKNLINILASEKEQDGKTVIWLAGKPAVVPISQAPASPAQDGELRDEVTALQGKVERYYRGLLGGQEGMQGQMKVVQDLVRDNSQAQYAEVHASQEAIYRKLEKIEKQQDLSLLYIICGGSLLLSLLALGRKTQKG